MACGVSSPESPDTTGSAVWNFLQEVNYQEDGELGPGKGEKYQGGEPHGALFTTYLSPAALDALTGKAGSMPNGAIIVKENYTADGTLPKSIDAARPRGREAAGRRGRFRLRGRHRGNVRHP